MQLDSLEFFGVLPNVHFLQGWFCCGGHDFFAEDSEGSKRRQSIITREVLLLKNSFHGRIEEE